MPYFLAIVLQKEIESGSMFPSFYLSDRSRYFGLQILHNNPDWIKQRYFCLFLKPYGNEIYVRQMVRFVWPREYWQGKKHCKTFYHPNGAVFYFECDYAGNPTGQTIFVARCENTSEELGAQTVNSIRALEKNTDSEVFKTKERTKNAIQETLPCQEQTKEINMSTIFTREPRAGPYPLSGVKIHLPQVSYNTKWRQKKGAPDESKHL